MTKARADKIDSVRGRVPLFLRHELYAYPSVPVIRVLLKLSGQPDNPLALEPFINGGDPQQRAGCARLAEQQELRRLF